MISGRVSIPVLIRCSIRCSSRWSSRFSNRVQVFFSQISITSVGSNLCHLRCVRILFHLNYIFRLSSRATALFRLVRDHGSFSSFKRCKGVSALCRSRRELSNEYLLAKIGVDTAENEPLEVWGQIQFIIHSPPYSRLDRRVTKAVVSRVRRDSSNPCCCRVCHLTQKIAIFPSTGNDIHRSGVLMKCYGNIVDTQDFAVSYRYFR